MVGEAAGYIVRDAAEQNLINGGYIPKGVDEIPLIIQDRTFVPNITQRNNGPHLELGQRFTRYS